MVVKDGQELTRLVTWMWRFDRDGTNQETPAFGDPLRHVSYVEVDVARVHAMSEAFDYLLRMY